MRAFLHRAFVHELPLKVVALFLTGTLFLVVRSDRDAAAGVFVKVVYQLPQDRVLVSEPVSEVRVGVRGAWTRLSHLDEREIEPIVVDLSKSAEQLVRFREDMVRLPVGLRAVSVSPSEVRLRYEPRLERSVPVAPLLEGQPADGYRVTHVVAQPQEVRVDGARSAVLALKRVATRPLRVVDATGPIRGVVTFETPPRHIRYLEPQSVSVEAEIQPTIVEQSFSNVHIKVAGASRLEGMAAPGTVQVILRGPSDLVRRVARETVTATIDMRLEDSRPPGLYRKRVQVTDLPAGLAAEVRPDAIVLSTHHHRD
jgi:YbbR domain-containing protein